MSAVWLRLLIGIFCFSYTSQAATVHTDGVIWRQSGDSMTIQCRSSQTGRLYLYLRKGLSKDFEVLYKASQKNTVSEKYAGRLQVTGAVASVDIVISNLTHEDTGPYWCVYEMFDSRSYETTGAIGTGSVLLVVTDEQQCDQPNKNLLLVTAVVSAAVLFGVFIAFLLWIIPKIKRWHAKMVPRHTVSTDVYEDMRATLRP
uniref:uncharacterized protein LOC131103395 n=1 Tax=Doryrhamphus excisus TaxID=161450 RepID=UPI0025AEC4CC|nr:uncharacterized protein LOC131103395 [Doryrhamphus excisus]